MVLRPVKLTADAALLPKMFAVELSPPAPSAPLSEGTTEKVQTEPIPLTNAECPSMKEEMGQSASDFAELRRYKKNGAAMTKKILFNEFIARETT